MVPNPKPKLLDQVREVLRWGHRGVMADSAVYLPVSAATARWCCGKLIRLNELIELIQEQAGLVGRRGCRNYVN